VEEGVVLLNIIKEATERCRKIYWCSVKFPVEVGVEESIVNEPLEFFKLHIKNTNNAKREVRFKQLSCNPCCVHNRLFNANFAGKF
jgi:hypothetical protein